MKILFFSFLTPSVKFGGGLGVLKSLNALCRIGEVFYIGPEYNKEEVADYCIEFAGSRFIQMESNGFARIRNLIAKGSSSLFVKDWEAATAGLDIKEYDIIYLERTLAGFACKWAKNTGLPVVVMTHNVEYDYFKSNRNSRTAFANSALAWIVKKNEKACVEYASRVIVLTKRDKDRFVELYGNSSKYEIIPVCVNQSSGTEAFHADKPYILLTGSLWFGPNADGIIWFLENVWQQINQTIDMKVVVAGSNPNQKLLDCIDRFDDVMVIRNPDDMGMYYRGASIFVAPIFEGAGMKVKVAEAMSYGLPIIATEHAAIGYEQAEKALTVVKSPEDCIECLKALCGMNDEQLSHMKKEISIVFKKNYSAEAFLNSLNRILKQIVGE